MVEINDEDDESVDAEDRDSDGDDREDDGALDDGGAEPNCNKRMGPFEDTEIRHRLERYARTGTFHSPGKVRKTLGVDFEDYRKFMLQSGSYAGSELDTYEAGWRYLKALDDEFDAYESARAGSKAEAVGEGDDGDCDQLRRLISKWIDAGHNTAGELQERFEVDSTDYEEFMGQTGKHAGKSQATFEAAWRHFKMREQVLFDDVVKKDRAIALAKHNANKTHAPSGEEAKKTAKKARASSGGEAKTTAKKQKTDPVHEDISDIHLDGEDEDKVPVYDSCDAIREKMSAYLQRDGVTKASFLRECYAQLHSEGKPRGMQTRQLDSFRGKRGANEGNSSSVFYSAYVFFEKLRIKQGLPKSEHRLEMEREWGPKGFEVDKPNGVSSQWSYVTAGSTPYVSTNSVGRTRVSSSANRI